MTMNTYKKSLYFILLLVVFNSCQKDEVDSISANRYKSIIADAWVSFTIDKVKTTPGFSPPVAARTYAYLSLAMYEAAVHGMPGYRSMAGQIPELNVGDLPEKPETEINWELAVNAAAQEIIKACMSNAAPNNEKDINLNAEELERSLNSNVSSKVKEASINYGKLVGSAIAKYAASDKQENCFNTNFPSNYILPQGEGFWKPTGSQLIPLQPYWGSVRKFSGTRPVNVTTPIEYSTSKNSVFYKEAEVVYNTYKNLSYRERLIAEYWSDDPGKTGTPPGHSMSIARIVINKEKFNLTKALETYAKLGMALHDAFVSCWDTKYKYNLVRPVTYIKENIDNTFETVLTTPPFPEYTSGHSVQSGATATILESIFGIPYTFTDNTHENRTDINGSPRSFVSFDDFAQEAAVSRLYGGIHYRQGIDEGVRQGREVGRNILKLKFK